MNRKNIYQYIVLALFAVSCDTLDQEPVNRIDVDGAITTNAGLQFALKGMYDGMQIEDYYGFRYLLYQDTYTDNLAHSGTFSTDQEVSSRRINPSNLQLRTTWRRMYEVIRNANFVLYSIPSVDNISEEEASAIEAEARFIRAFVHYDLLRVFGGIPIMTEFVENTNALILSPRDSEEEVYNFLISELTFAEANLGNTADRPFRAGPGAATALLARVQLQAGNYAEAATKASEVIESGNYALQTSYSDLFSIKGNNEMILELNFTNTDGDQSLLAIASDPATGGQKFYLRPPFFNAFQASGDQGDVRFDASVLDNGSRLRAVKYYRSSTSDDNVPLLRLAEMYLIRAEANARLAGSGALSNLSIIDDINVIRGRAGLEELTNADLPTVQRALDEILVQRRFEFAFEGHRYSDLQRYGLVSGLFPANEQFRVLWPIPLQEIEVNNNLVQNPGY
ncbi:hypothetical protein J2X69_001424 [Algoriphagus sp. 4150]|uniref:RagB/SusD family nutrient uptake outer membrane protein n=1 Tax=Algoriphagus sp. 4150 TaxID=2817756 RepID=UPI00285FA8B0|nr:RagB/SusD family nutrient uptake outer membrane protein [Algoriphagus sp. 4150]MDR7129089.1 hypothetical protein [Algoriphagus sp. 4150]